MELSEDNIKRLTNWVEKESRIQDPSFIIQPSQIYSFNSETIQRCPSCLEIPRFPRIFACGHLECHNCYIKDFKVRGRHRKNIYFSYCPNCRLEVNFKQVWTTWKKISYNFFQRLLCTARYKFSVTTWTAISCTFIRIILSTKFSHAPNVMFNAQQRPVHARVLPSAYSLILSLVLCILFGAKVSYSKWFVAGYVNSKHCKLVFYY